MRVGELTMRTNLINYSVMKKLLLQNLGSLMLLSTLSICVHPIY